MSAATPLLAVEGLTATPHGADAPVLRDIDFRLAGGERVVLTGPSGSGKSTLLRCMVLLEPAEGRVRFRGRPVGADDVRELRRRVGYVPQRPVSIADTIAGNLAFPRELGGDALGEAEQRRLLDTLGLGGLRLERRFDDLSGGEQQRVTLVRSLTPRPDVLLLDEPTASLDPENVDAVVALLRAWAEEDAGRALVWVSHQTDPVDALATRRVSLRDLGGAGAGRGPEPGGLADKASSSPESRP